MIRIKRNYSNLTIKRNGKSSALILPFKNQKEKKKLEEDIIELFNDDFTTITIIDECGNLKRIVTP